MPSIPATAEPPLLEVPLLEVTGLDVAFATPDGTVRAVQEVGFTVARGEALGIVGESGAGKSQVVLALMGLLAANGSVAGSARFRGTELLGLERRALDRI